MSISSLLKVAEKYAVDNSPRLLTAFGAAGTITTAYLTAKASFKAAKTIQREEQDRMLQQQLSEIPLPKKLPLTKKEKFDLVWIDFIPPIVCGVASVACIIAANSIHSSRYAALAAAYKLSDRSFTEYKDKVKETLGMKEETQMRDELNQDRVNQNPPTGQQVLIGDGEVLCYEPWTGRYFKSDMETLKKAMNDVNYQIIEDRYATMSDLYDKIGLDYTAMSNEMGWSIEKPLDIYFGTQLANNGQPCIVVEYNQVPFSIRESSFQAD